MDHFLRNKSKLLLISVLALTLILAGVTLGCEEQVEEEEATVEGADGEEIPVQKEIEMAKVEWTCATQKAYVNTAILETLGYDVSRENYTLPIIIEGMSNGEIDFFTDAWDKTWGQPLDEALKAGDMIDINTQIDDASYSPAVPTYVYEAGVQSLEDLAKYSDKFEYSYYGLESGNDGNEIMIEAFDNDTYGLGEWDIVESNEAAMITDVRQQMEDEEWVVFSGWEPHYMNVVLDMEYLDDPKGIWGDSESISTVVRDGLEEADPNLTKYLKQFDVDQEIVNEWVYEFGYHERDPEEVAEEWITENIDIVLQWVDGVYTVDGEDGQEAIENEFK
ncbi:glycine betaine ABC transporter substrate-binding protein [Natranaerobius trueperi]|uniref:Glycine/betaine ABC transporter substrate-binding protein n=1 Tax=Natranaerobius trueperi TaxID=759412 RepID=A0A226BZ03_9FIRM|nr:glycine betaine ABC transporter substrate-binding protein [Natranaerobius trueperi]OWZ83554.1 glycine/betaine ABC transporter substrate-binding protein [Natranaerobius trueperi]